jgi:hypothetical protein
MSGISTIYCIGSGGGFMGGDGPNPILAQIWLGEGCRMWYEARYFEKGFGPLGQLKTLIPPEPDGPDNLLDACLAFFPKAFETCPSLATVLEQLGDMERLDFDAAPEDIPAAWTNFREESRSEFAKLPLWEAEMRLSDKPA